MTKVIEWVDGQKVVRDAVAADTVPAPVTNEDVNTERQRRITSGVSVSVTGVTDPIPLQGRAEDQMALLGLKNAAELRVAGGDTTTITTFRDGANNDRQLTPPQVIELWSLGAAWVASVYAASWALKDQDPIPTDYLDDDNWP